MKLCPIIFSIIVINWELINAAHTTDFALSEPELDTKNEATQIQNGTENEIKLLGDNFAFSLNLQVIENIVKKIENEKCVRDIRISLNSLMEGEVWALKMFDSLPKFPSGLLDGNLFVMGNFHECVETEWRQSNSTFSGQYCLAEVYFKLYKDNGGLFRMDPNLSQHVRMRFNSSVVHWGMCAPSSCTPTDVKVFVEETFSIVDSFESLRANVNDKNCYARRETRITNGEIIYASLIGLVFLFAIMSTTVHYWQIHRRKRSAVYNIDGLRREISTANEIILCFSIIRVVRSLLRTKPNEFNLECICGIKFLSMMLIIAGHSLIFILGGPISNIKFISKEYTDPLNGVLVNPLLVDTFLLVSGFLMCRLLLAELDKRNGKINIFVLYITRYVRLTPAYLVILGFYLTWMSRLAEGPLWNKTIVTEKEKCQQSWWTNLLYVNNYIKTDSLCMFQSWYLAADYHLFVLSPCIIFPLWRWRKVGKLLLAIIMLASISLPFYITYIGNLDPTLLAFPPEIQDISSNKYFLTAYVKTHMRASSYCFGLLLGYIVYRIQSAETKISNIIMWSVSILVGAICLASMLSIVIFFSPTHTDSNMENAIYAALHRVGWCLGIGWIILLCVTEHAEPIAKFLSWKPFVTLSRLTYCAYLINGFIVIYDKGVIRDTIYLDKYQLSCKILGHLVITFSAAFLLCIFFESPIHGLEKLMLKKFSNSAVTK